MKESSPPLFRAIGCVILLVTVIASYNLHREEAWKCRISETYTIFSDTKMKQNDPPTESDIRDREYRDALKDMYGQIIEVRRDFSRCDILYFIFNSPYLSGFGLTGCILFIYSYFAEWFLKSNRFKRALGS